MTEGLAFEPEDEGPRRVVAQAGLASAQGKTGPEQQDEPETADTEGEG